MKQLIRPWKPGPARSELVHLCNTILEDEFAGYTLTLRQLYYQLVSRNVLPNTERSYHLLGKVVARGRMAGLIDWDLIEDRVRTPWSMPEFASIAELIQVAIRSYRLPRWRGQEYYAELWVEKDALAGVLQPLAAEFHVTLMVNRGYSSVSAMKAASDRYLSRGQKLHLFYLGDFDPSGEDMVRDISDRLFEFGADVKIVKIALTWEQVQQYSPPPNPVKVKDSRARAFIDRYGASSWEVDALPPQVLEELIRAHFAAILDREAMDEVIEQEEKDKTKLQKWVSRDK